MLHSHRNESIELHGKSIDWFLYECNINLIWFEALEIGMSKSLTGN